MTKKDINEMLELFQSMFEEKATEDSAEWYNNVAQGLAFATNSIPKTETEGES